MTGRGGAEGAEGAEGASRLSSRAFTFSTTDMHPHDDSVPCSIAIDREYLSD